MHGNNNFLIPSRFIGEIDDDLLEPIKSNNTRPFKSNKKYKMSDQKFDDEYSQETHTEHFSQEDNSVYIKIGQRVRHLKFGNGVILSYTGKGDSLKIHINFESYGKKWLVMSYAQLDFNI
jgi:DNA helicase-2/ATP-dependent DNA helicase PcrA